MPDDHDALTTALLQQHYAQARQHLDSTACLVLLHLGAQHSGIAVGSSEQAPTLHLLPLGFERTASEQFKTTPPTPLAMENAIMVVEDVVMPLRKLIPRDAQLFSLDAAARDIAVVSGVAAVGAPSEPLVLSLEAMEHSFNRLVAVLQGGAAAAGSLSASNHFAAALLILREFMHHLQFAQLTVLDAGRRT